jgi:hypothetical protein
MVMLDCNNYFGLLYNMDMFDSTIDEWLCDIETFILVELCLLPTCMNGYVALWHQVNVMLYCGIHKGFCRIVTFIEGYIGLQYSFMVISYFNIHLVALTVMAHCSFHQISCHIVMFTKGFFAF